VVASAGTYSGEVGSFAGTSSGGLAVIFKL
jgi:hypothetical protein